MNSLRKNHYRAQFANTYTEITCLSTKKKIFLLPSKGNRSLKKVVYKVIAFKSAANDSESRHSQVISVE